MNSQFKVDREYFPFFFLCALLLFLIPFSFARWEVALRVGLLFLLPITGFADDFENRKKSIEIYNQGIEQYQSNELEKAASSFFESALSAPEARVKKKAFFNLGNTYLKMGDPLQAIQAYQQAHDIHTDDTKFEDKANQEISENMVLAMQMEEQKQKEEKNKKGKGDQEGKEKDGQGDPGGPEQHQLQPLSEDTKKKMYDLVSQEERQALQRLFSKGKGNIETDKPW